MKRFIPYSYEVTRSLFGATNVHRCTAFREVDIAERIDDHRGRNSAEISRFHAQGEFVRLPSTLMPTTPALSTSTSGEFLQQNLSLITAGLRRDGLMASDPIDPYDPGVISTDHDWAYARAKDFADQLLLGGSGHAWSSAHGIFEGRLHPAAERSSSFCQVRDLLDGWRLGTMTATSCKPLGQAGLLDEVIPDKDLIWPPDLAQPDDIRAADLVHHLSRGIRHDPMLAFQSRHAEAAAGLLAMQARLYDLQAIAPSRWEMAAAARDFLVAIVEDPADRLSSVVRSTDPKAFLRVMEQIDFCEAVIASAPDLSVDSEDLDVLEMLAP